MTDRTARVQGRVGGSRCVVMLTQRRRRGKLRRMKPTTTPKTRGGRRAGAGRKSRFRDAGQAKQPFAMMMTRDGLRQLDAHAARTSMTRNEVIEQLLRDHPRAAVPHGADPYPGKYPMRLSIRLTSAAGALLDALAAKSGQSRGVVAEHLTRTYGGILAAPASGAAPRRSPVRGRRRP